MSELELIGREGLLASLRERASVAGSTITLRGPGGVGKTSCSRALLVAHRGIFVELDVCSNVDDVVAAVGEAIPLAQSARHIGGIVETLATQGFPLIVLDNAEHVTEPTARFVESLREASDEVRVVVTSRERLGIRGEELIDVGPLSTDDGAKLFELRAREVVPSFALSEDNRDAVRRLVELVDGLPLAIELAASRVRLLDPARILARLDEQFGLLRARDAKVERHATLDACIGWSVDLLSAEERSVLSQLSIFRGRFSMEDAEAIVVCEGWVGDAIEMLIERSLLRVEHHERGTEYVPYEGVRRYVETHAPFDDELIRRYARYYAGRMAHHGVRHAELQNVVRAWELSKEVDFRLAVDLLVQARHRLIRGGFLPRLFEMIDAALAHAELDEGLEAWLHAALASCHYAVMDYDSLQVALDRADELSRGLDLPEVRARVHLMRAVRLSETDHANEAEAHLEEARGFLDALPADLCAHILGASGLVATKRRRPTEALDYFERAIAAARRTDDGGVVARTLSWSALGYFAAGFRQRGLSRLEEALEYFADVNDSVSLTQARLTLGHALADIDAERSRELAEAARESAAQSRLRFQSAQCEVLLARHDPTPAAVDRLRRTLSLFTAQAVRNDRWENWLALGLKLLELGSLREATTELQNLVRAMESYESTDLAGLMRRYLAVFYAMAEDLDAARDVLDQDDAFLRLLRGETDDASQFDDPYHRMVIDFQPLPHEVWARRDDVTLRPRVRVIDDASRLELPDGSEVDLETRYVLRRLFLAFLEARRERPGEPLTLEDLIEAGWPDESMTYESGIRRVYSAIRNLRKLGLEDVVLTAENGYLLSTALDFDENG